MLAALFLILFDGYALNLNVDISTIRLGLILFSKG